MRTWRESRPGRQLPLLPAGIAATVGVAMLPPLAAQSPPAAARGPAFEAASVKPNRSGSSARAWSLNQAAGSPRQTCRAAELIRFAYDLRIFRSLADRSGSTPIASMLSPRPKATRP